MDQQDLLVCALFGCTFAPILFGTTLIWWLSRKDRPRYLPDEGTLAEQFLAEPGPFELQLPPGPACDLMIRRTVTGRKDFGDRGYKYGLQVTLDVRREGTERGGFEHEGSYGFGRLARQRVSKDAVVTVNIAYANEKMGDQLTQTHIILRIPAGGAGTIKGRLESHTQLSAATLFVKPV